MQQVHMVVEHLPDLPEGMPALWKDERCPSTGDRAVYLYLREDLPVDMQDRFRSMAVRDVMPNADFDAFTVVPSPMPTAISAERPRLAG